jgi:outer membrane protein TolC
MKTKLHTLVPRGVLRGLLLCLPWLVLPATAGAAGTWTLDRVLAAAADGQPDSAALRAAARGAEADAEVAASLPPPMWRAGIVNLPVTGRDAFDPNVDDMTMRMVGIEQAWPSRALREASAGMARSRAGMYGAEAAMRARMRAERAGMAWLDAWLAGRRITLYESQIDLLARAEAAALAAAGEGMDGASAVLEWRAMRAMRELAVLRERQQRDEALADLAARLGMTVESGELADALPDWPAPDAQALRASLARLPDVTRLEAEAAEADAERAMRAAEARPQWTWMLGYGERMPGMPEMASLEVRVSFDGLFGRRQSLRESAAAARGEAAALRRDDRLRGLAADLERALVAEARAREALDLIERELMPLRRRQVALAEARYAQGPGGLMAAFEARSALLDLEAERWMSVEALWRARLRLMRLDADRNEEYTP